MTGASNFLWFILHLDFGSGLLLALRVGVQRLEQSCEGGSHKEMAK